MHTHHQAAIDRAAAYFQDQPEVEALVLSGSIAHGFASETSDVDVMIIVSAAEHRRRFERQDLQFFSTDLAGYPGGYIDGKYVSRQFLDEVEQRGSEPARFAFADGRVIWSRDEGLPDQLRRISRYPEAARDENIRRFYAQLQAWTWYAGEAAGKRDPYLMTVASAKLQLFGGRLILAHNRLLYPYHKWFMRVLAGAPDKPAGLIEAMRALDPAGDPARFGEAAAAFSALVNDFRPWGGDASKWPNRFMLDSELNWMHGATPVDDL